MSPVQPSGTFTNSAFAQELLNATDAAFGLHTAIALTAWVNDQAPDRRKIIDSVLRVDGMDPSDNPLTEMRPDIHLPGGRWRRAACAERGVDRHIRSSGL